MIVKIELPEIQGYEYTGEYRKPAEGEYCFQRPDLPLIFLKRGEYSNVYSFILKKIMPDYRECVLVPERSKDKIRMIEFKAVEDAIELIHSYAFGDKTGSQQVANLAALKELMK